MKKIDDKSIDMILCDLPYGTTWAKWDSIIDFDLLWKEYNRICKGAIVLFSSQPFTTKLNNSNIKNYRYTWYWVKNIAGNYLNAKRQPLRKVEDINVFESISEISVFNKHNYSPQGLQDCDKISRRGSSAKTTMQNYDNEWHQTKTGYPTNVLTYPLDKEKLHPTQKPVALIEYLIKTYTSEGDLVLDNCIGSGTTAVGCINTNRNYIGFELDNAYYEIAKNRIGEALIYKGLQNE